MYDVILFLIIYKHKIHISIFHLYIFYPEEEVNINTFLNMMVETGQVDWRSSWCEVMSLISDHDIIITI